MLKVSLFVLKCHYHKTHGNTVTTNQNLTYKSVQIRSKFYVNIILISSYEESDILQVVYIPYLIRTVITFNSMASFVL